MTTTPSPSAAAPPATGPGVRRAGSSNLVDTLLFHARTKGADVHLVLREQDREVETLTFGQLCEGTLAVARALVARGAEPGSTVALMLPTGRDFYFGFLGILAAGAVPVPIYPPVRLDQLEEYVGRHAGILANAEVTALLTFREAEAVAHILQPRIRSLRHVVRVDRLLAEGRATAAADRFHAARADDLALIQYTSGSTGDPKGVTLTHANLLANVDAIGEVVEVGDGDVVVSWLPLYHDMGLIGCWLFALAHGLKMVSFSPLDFLRRPRRWLRAMSDYGGTLSPAPNFAYELCLRRIADRDLEGLDLSTWRVALNGSEPVSPTTLKRFQARFGPYGFRPQTMTPAYGLAENAVALTFPPLAAKPRVDHVLRAPFEHQGRAEPVSVPGLGDELAFVSVGRAIPGHEVRVVGAGGVPAAERVEGQVEFRGLSTTPGYYRNPEATAALRTADGWTRSGDLGYLAEGDLFITGRSKDLIIKGGRNIYPQEVEAVAAEVEGVRRGCVAAFGLQGADGLKERLIVVVETRSREAPARGHIAAEVKRRVNAALHVSPDEVVMVAPHTVPKTPSGKLRRLECRDRYLAGALEAWRPPGWWQVVRLKAGSIWRQVRGTLTPGPSPRGRGE